MAAPFFSSLFNLFLCLHQLCFSLYQHFPERLRGRQRRSRGGPGSNSRNIGFPNNQTVDVLSRLPTKSLVRFSTVHKSWQALTRNHDFINRNIAKLDQQSGRLVVKYCSRNTRKHVIFLLFQGTHNGHTLSNLETTSVMDIDHLKRVGSSNGLLGLAHDYFAHLGSPIILWNPAINEFRVLPDSVIGTANVLNVQVCGVAHGFGYHQLIDDYKVVRVACFSRWNKLYIRTEVYSMKMRCWREIDRFYFCIYEPSCTAVDGALYWIAYGRGDSEVIVSFDMCEEVFEQLQLPDLSFVENPMCTKLAVLKESLHLISYTFSGRQKEFYVWKRIE